MNQAWTAYYLRVGETEKGLDRLSIAAESDPKLWFAVADICQQDKQLARRKKALQSARREFQSRLEADALDTVSRLLLAKALARLDKHDDAEQILLAGFKMQPDATTKRAISEFYIARHDQLAGDNTRFSEQFRYLQKSIEFDASNALAYDRLTLLFLGQSSENDRAKVKSALLELVSGDQPSAMAHFALSNLFEAEGDRDKAVWHLERAYSLDKSIVNVINNLAWMLAHQAKPDLDRALRLAEQAVEQMPGNAEFLDTLGSILVLQEKWERAIQVLESALPNMREKNEVHVKLATCYRAIDRPEIAKMHMIQSTTE